MLSLTSSTAAAPLVLIVDDDVDSCEMYSTCVKAAGLRVASAYDGETGLHRALKSPPDVLVTDIVMPGLDGFELTRRLRETATLEELPVIAVTARTITPAEVERLGHGGPTSVLLKPCEPIRLLVEIWDVLRASQALRARAAALIERSAHAQARAVDACERSVVQHERWLTLVTSQRLREAERMRDTLLALPTIVLSVPEAARYCAVDESTAVALLDSLVNQGFLVLVDGHYRRP